VEDLTSFTEQVGDMLPVGEAAKFLGVMPETLRNWDNFGRLVPTLHPVIGCRYYHQRDLDLATAKARLELSLKVSNVAPWNWNNESNDGLLAIDAVKQASADGRLFDLILLDMQMPNLNGYAAAERLRQMGFDGPIIALTANAIQGNMIRCLKCGCHDYFSEPIDVQLLKPMVGICPQAPRFRNHLTEINL